MERLMYRVWYTAKNNVGGKERCVRDNNGRGLQPSAALYVAGALKAQGKTNVKIVRAGSREDLQEMKGGE